MKKIVLFSLAICMFGCATGKAGYTIKGKVAGLKDGTAILSAYGEARQIVLSDTVPIKDGVFKFTGNVNEPASTSVSVAAAEAPDVAMGISLILENCQINVECDMANVKDNYGYKYFEDVVITGSPNNKLNDELGDVYENLLKDPKNAEFAKQMKQLETLRDSDIKAYEELREKIDPQMQSISEENRKIQQQMITDNPTLEVGAMWLNRIMSDMSLEQIEVVFNGLDPKVQNSIFAKEVRDEITALKAVMPGQPAPEFTLMTPDGKPLSLSDLKGKYVLVDFWASWCGPCRAAVPELKELYKKYKDSGFEILGIANDTDHDKWKKAIEEDESGWLHVVDEFPVKNSTSRVGNLFAIHYLPTLFLIDADGKMIGKVTKDELKVKLKEIFEK